MRLLIVSYYFPPYNTIGAVRVGKTAAGLARLGHDVRVLTADHLPLPESLPLEIDEQRVTRTRWWDVNRPVQWALGGRHRVAAQGYAVTGRFAALAKPLGRWWRTLINYPDGQIGWLPFAMRGGHELLGHWRPDAIFASAMPATSLLVASRLARRHVVPWIAELRDLWTDECGYAQPTWRKALERRLERSVLSSAAGLVTVSQPLADILQSQFARPTAVVLNGYDPLDFASICEMPPRGGPLRIVYTGMIYEGRRDPEPLLEALARLGEVANGIRVAFYGRYLQTVHNLASRHGVGRLIEVHEPVPYRESLRMQQQADVLLLLLERDPEQRGVFTGKLFEYLGARRPVLAVGPTGNVAADLLVERQAGVVSNDVDAIARQLRAWLAQKQQCGGLPALPATVGAGLTRTEQVAKLDAFLHELVPDRARRRAA